MPSPVTAVHRFQIILLLVLACVVLVAVGREQEKRSPSSKIQVTTSFYPLGDFAKQIGGDRITVTTVTPSGAEPHEYEPTPSDLTAVDQAKLFLYNGADLDLWADKIAPRLEQKGVIAIKASTLVDLQAAAGTTNGTLDPHIWLDPVRVKKISAAIHDALVQIDPQHKNVYDNGIAALQFQLDTLDAAYRDGLAHCTTKTIVTSHAAFGYLAARYHLDQVYLSGIAPDEEPSAQRLATVATTVQHDHISTIFFESLVSSKFADTIATEVGAKTAVLNPIEGLTADQIKHGDTYLTIMYQNLTALRRALQCS